MIHLCMSAIGSLLLFLLVIFMLYLSGTYILYHFSFGSSLKDYTKEDPEDPDYIEHSVNDLVNEGAMFYPLVEPN